MTSDPNQNLPPPPPPSHPWARATMWMVIVFLVMASGIYVFKSMRDLPGDVLKKTGSVLEKTRSALVDVASAFNQKNVTTSFLSYATSISPNHYLQFATLKQTEIFTEKDEARTGFGYIPLPDVIIEAKAPVEYTYYLDLNAKWELVLKDKVIYVLAPAIKFNTPAVDASEIHYEIKKGSVLRNNSQAEENLKKSISFLARLRARENIPLVRETGRKQTSEFVEKWLAKSFSDGNNYPIKVFFSNEKLPDELKAANLTPRPLD
jgi:hypothetical protein